MVVQDNNIFFEDIDYRNFDLLDSLISGMCELEIFLSFFNNSDYCFIVFLDLEFCKKEDLSNCMFMGFIYDWLYYYDGVIIYKFVFKVLLDWLFV